MKKFFTSFAFIFAFGAYAVNQYLGAGSAPTETLSGPESVQTDTLALTSSAPSTTQVASKTEIVSSSVAKPAPKTETAPAKPVAIPSTSSTPVTPAKSGRYADGTYTGSAANAFYGYVQVRAVVSGGNLTDVMFLSYPNDRRESQSINSRAMPVLKREAIAAQSAQVSGVSGATDTSMAFRQSLASALSQAKS